MRIILLFVGRGHCSLVGYSLLFSYDVLKAQKLLKLEEVEVTVQRKSPKGRQ